MDEADLSAETVAAKIGVPPDQVFKTLVARGDRNGVCLAVISGNQQLNLKALARLSAATAKSIRSRSRTSSPSRATSAAG